MQNRCFQQVCLQHLCIHIRQTQIASKVGLHVRQIIMQIVLKNVIFLKVQNIHTTLTNL